MEQLDLAYVSAKGWIIDVDLHGILYSPSDIVFLPTHYGEVVYPDVIARDVTMVIDGGRGPEVLLEPFLKHP